MRVGFVGKGALGLLFAPVIQQHCGKDSVCFIMDDERFERHAADVYTVNGEEIALRDVRASQALDEGAFDLLLLSVKTTSLDDALKMAKPLVGPETLVVPLLNGVTSEERCAAVLGWEHVVGCVSAGMDAARFGTALQYSKMGQLILGVANEATPTACAQRAYDLLSGAGVPCSLVDNLRYRLWCKFIANVGLNQTCCAFGVNYAQLFGDQTSEAFRTYIGAMREVIAVGNAEGVPLTEADMNAYIQVALSLDPLSMPSMAQDRVNKNKTEVDEFSGVIIALAEKHGLWVPCNRYLNAAIKEIEAAY